MRRVLVLALLALVTGPASAAGSERDRQIEALRAERDTRAQEASRLADEIARLKAATRGPRAGGELEQRLRAFDRLAHRLDELERRLARLDADSRLVPGGLTEADVRPLLDIDLGPADVGSVLDAKIALLQAERARGTTQSERLEAALRVLTLRLETKERQAREAETARRDAGTALPLLRRQADESKIELHELQSARAVVQRRQGELARELATIEQRLAEAERRRAGAGSTSP